MAWYKCIGNSGGGGSSEISEIVRLTETEWNNLSTKDNNKIYNVTNSNGDMIKKTYQGNRRILRKSDISDYEFWYEDLRFPRYYISGDFAMQYYWINDGIQIFLNENLNRGWQLEFNVDPQSSNENPIIGTASSNPSSATAPTQNLEIYPRGSNLLLYGKISAKIPNAIGEDVIIKYENGTVTVYVNDVVAYTTNFTPVADTDNYFIIGDYRNNYCFEGVMNYIGFKWLSTPSPSGADGYTYDLSVDNNYTLNVVEYNNGTQTQADSFTDSDLSNPVTFGDIIISYNIGADAFIIKPNYVDGKSIKLNNVLYSGNNEIEFISGETGLPSYAESQIYTLTGWIE